MPLVLQSSQNITHVGIFVAMEVAAPVDQDAQIVPRGKVIYVRGVKAHRDICDFVTKVNTPVRVVPRITAKDFVFGLNISLRCSKDAQSTQRERQRNR